MEFFSTPELIEIGGYPFPVQGYKPTREEAIEYYRGVAAREQLDIRLYERVLAVARRARRLHRRRPTSGEHRARHVVVVDRLLRPAEPARRARRGSAEGDALLSGAVPLRAAEGGGDRREELGREGGARLLPPRRARSR